DTYRCTVEPDANRRGRLVELRIVHLRRDDVFHRVAGSRTWYEGAYEQAGNGGITVGEMKDVWFFLSSCFFFTTATPSDLHSLETGKSHAATGFGGHRIDSDAEQVVRQGLIELRYVRMGFYMLQEIVLITCRGEFHAFLLG